MIPSAAEDGFRKKRGLHRRRVSSLAMNVCTLDAHTCMIKARPLIHPDDMHFDKPQVSAPLLRRVSGIARTARQIGFRCGDSPSVTLRGLACAGRLTPYSGRSVSFCSRHAAYPRPRHGMPRSKWYRHGYTGSPVSRFLIWDTDPRSRAGLPTTMLAG